MIVHISIPEPGEIWMHSKRGSKYRILYLARMQFEVPELDDKKYIVYQSTEIEEKQVWVRSVREFVMNRRFTIVN